MLAGAPGGASPRGQVAAAQQCVVGPCSVQAAGGFHTGSLPGPHSDMPACPCCTQMVRLHDRDSSGTISLDEFRTLHLQARLLLRCAAPPAARRACCTCGLARPLAAPFPLPWLLTQSLAKLCFHSLPAAALAQRHALHPPITALCWHCCSSQTSRPAGRQQRQAATPYHRSKPSN